MLPAPEMEGIPQTRNHPEPLQALAGPKRPGPENRVSLQAVRAQSQHPPPALNRNPKRKEPHEVSHSLPEQIALSQEHQIESSHSNPTRATAEPGVPPKSRWSAKLNSMNAINIESRFTAIGARLKVRVVAPEWRPWGMQRLKDYAMDLGRDDDGQFFELRVPEHLSGSMDVTVSQAEPKQRHLLLFVRKAGDKPQLDRFLCGHDEREWFVAAVPGGASSVRQAMDALQPGVVRAALARNSVSSAKRYGRKNRAFRRQGEWFFVPEPSFVAEAELILRNEPLRRGAGKPHRVAELFRSGGETVQVCDRHPNGVTPEEYRSILQRNPAAVRWGWRVMRRNPGVYARGTVRHRDHATITLPFWHRVIMNTETQSRTMRNVAFLD